jgi:hypothetical protein
MISACYFVVTASGIAHNRKQPNRMQQTDNSNSHSLFFRVYPGFILCSQKFNFCCLLSKFLNVVILLAVTVLKVGS